MEKLKEQQSKPAEIETSIEKKLKDPLNRKSIDEITIELEDVKNERLLELKELIDQQVARLDFEKDKNGEVTSVIIKRVLNGETLFHANNKSWIGRQDIKRVLGLIEGHSKT